MDTYNRTHDDIYEQRVVGPTAWHAMPVAQRDPAVESERVSAGLENAYLCRHTFFWEMSTLAVSQGASILRGNEAQSFIEI